MVRWLLAILMLLPVVGFLPGLFGERVMVPAEPKPLFLDLLVITAEVWPLVDGQPAMQGPALFDLMARSTSIEHAFTPSSVSEAAATSLFTGQWPTSTGVLAPGDRLPPGTWTLATAAQLRGNHTAAFLERPLVTATGLEGFAELVEEPKLDPEGLARSIVETWTAHPDRPSLIWVHLRDPGPEGARVDRLLQSLNELPGGLGGARRAEALVLLTALGSDGAITESDDSGFHVPLFLSLPADLFAGRRSPGSASLVDVSAALVELASLPPSSGRIDARPSVSTAFMGAEVYNWNLLLGPQGHVLRRGSQRLTAGGRPPGDPAQVGNWLLEEPDQDTGFTMLHRGPAQSEASQLYVRLLQQLL